MKSNPYRFIPQNSTDATRDAELVRQIDAAHAELAISEQNLDPATWGESWKIVFAIARLERHLIFHRFYSSIRETKSQEVPQ